VKLSKNFSRRKVVNLVRNDGADAKRERLESIASYLHAEFYRMKNQGQAREVPLNKAISKIEYKLGLSKKRIMEYLRVIEDDGQIKIDGDMVKPSV